jgi:hypothetical protein
MRFYRRIIIGAVLLVGAATASGWTYAEEVANPDPATCGKFKIDNTKSQDLHSWTQPADGGCKMRTAANGMLLPNAKCTPGAINPTVTQTVLRAPGFTTDCIRNEVTSEDQKNKTYAWYGIKPPQGDDKGESQTCELDHLISLELGGGDGLANIWPQCGPDKVTLDERYFKIKDKVENYLGEMVKAGKMGLDEARRGISTDWTQYIKASEEACKSKECKVQ